MSNAFELGKFYQHTGMERIHILAETKDSEMWMIDPGTKMFIAEERGGNLYGWGQADLDPSIPSHVVDKQEMKQPLPKHPDHLPGLRPVSGHAQDMNGWFEIDRAIYKLENNGEKISIKKSIYQQAKGVGREHVGFKYNFDIFVYNLKPQIKFYLLDHQRYRNCKIIPTVTTHIDDVCKLLIGGGVEKKKIYDLEKKLFKFML